MAMAAFQHILTAGLNIYVLELVVLYLGGSLALLFIGPGRFSFDAGIAAEALVEVGTVNRQTEQDNETQTRTGSLTPARIAVD
jgi:putative oxidoreductase